MFDFMFWLFHQVNDDLSQYTNNTRTVQLTQVVFREGQSVPSYFYPTDPYSTMSFHPEQPGQMSLKGQLIMFLLGLHLKEVYHPSGNIPLKNLTAYSSKSPLSQESLQMLLTGLQPPQFPLTSWFFVTSGEDPAPLDKERLFKRMLTEKEHSPFGYSLAKEEIFSGRKCSKMADLKSKLGNSSKYSNFTDQLKNLQLRTNLSRMGLEEGRKVFATLRAEENLNLSLPNWTESVYPRTLGKIAVAAIEENLRTDEMKKLAGGFLLQDLLKNMKESITQGGGSKKMFLYSGDEDNLVALLTLLGVFDGRIPDFGAYVALELRQGQGGYYVRIAYDDGSRVAKYLATPSCEVDCKFEKFENLTKKYLPDEKDCEGIVHVGE